MENLLIRVQYRNESLTIEQEAVTLEASADPNDPVPSVTWQFCGIDELVELGYTPRLRFGQAFLGPFETFCQTSKQLIGNGNTGTTGDYPYTAVLVSPTEGTQITSQSAVVTNNITDRGLECAPFIEVRAKRQGEGHVLDVKPEAIFRAQGQPVVWKVIGDVPDSFDAWYARVVFDQVPPDGDPHFGPFESWQGGQSTLIGAGHRGVPGRYKYRFELVSVTDESITIRSSPDPTVDDEGDPTGQGGPEDGARWDPSD